ncbi:MAG: bifunctional ADP-dependent NAD(P)H-hydrate dehydratase/NAD(P)H-hydrate epimerase, partial [Thermomicrobiales bacterium]|nr:bifunctional ADP-dependent NAD(P)H-hydrate dehydratase/NAD(P)H-hydrate epimerase [Thermomicrobiales bacterium]
MTSSKSVSVETISRADALRLLPKRDETAHKWGVGGLVIIGGAPGYIGAPALAAMSAGRSGAGIVSLAVPRSSVGVTAALVPEAVFLPLPDTDSSHGVQKAIELIRPHVEKSRALVVGPGLSRDEMATMLLEALFGNAPRTAARSLGFGAQTAKVASEPEDPVIGGDTHAVVDADALHWLAERESWWAQVRPFSLILTPHVGELAALTGADSREILNDPAAS